MIRNGKIAKLPSKVRQELNERLQNGEEGAPLLEWLNDLPVVHERLQASFGGAPISKQNLSEWRQGGFREWESRQDTIEQARQLAEGAREMDQALDGAALPGALATALAARYAVVLNTWDGEPNEKIEAQLRLLRSLNQDIALLQRTTQKALQQQADLARQQQEEDRRENEELKKQNLGLLWFLPESEALADFLGGDERAKLLARRITALNHHLPFVPGERAKFEAEKQAPSDGCAAPTTAPKPAASKPVKSSQTKLARVQAAPAQADTITHRQTESNPVKLDQIPLPDSYPTALGERTDPSEVAPSS